MPDLADLPLHNREGEESQLPDYAGEVVLVTGGDLASFQPLLDRYETDGLAVVDGGLAELVLVGRDGTEVARFPGDTDPSNPTLAAAIERELFASE